MNPNDDFIICYVQGLFEYRRVAEWRLLQDYDGKLRKRPVPDLEPGEILSVVPGQSMYRIIKHE